MGLFRNKMFRNRDTEGTTAVLIRGSFYVESLCVCVSTGCPFAKSKSARSGASGLYLVSACRTHRLLLLSAFLYWTDIFVGFGFGFFSALQKSTTIDFEHSKTRPSDIRRDIYIQNGNDLFREGAGLGTDWLGMLSIGRNRMDRQAVTRVSDEKNVLCFVCTCRNSAFQWFVFFCLNVIYK